MELDEFITNNPSGCTCNHWKLKAVFPCYSTSSELAFPKHTGLLDFSPWKYVVTFCVTASTINPLSLLRILLENFLAFSMKHQLYLHCYCSTLCPRSGTHISAEQPSISEQHFLARLHQDHLNRTLLIRPNRESNCW